MGNGCGCFCNKSSSPETPTVSNGDKNETLESMLDEIKHEIDDGNVNPRDVINRLNNLISQIEENKKPQDMGPQRGGFYHVVDKLIAKWEDCAKTGIPQDLGKLTAKFLQKVGVTSCILVGLSFVGSMLNRAIKVPENKEACTKFITTLACLLTILDSHLEKIVDLSTPALEGVVTGIVNSLSVCCKYASSAFCIRLLNADAVEAELNDAVQQLSTQVQNLGLDAQLKALYGIDQINKKLDNIKTFHVQVLEEDEEDENAVGIKQRVDEVKTLLRLENEDVKGAAVVLHGQGGMGKSTLARSVISSAKPHLSYKFTVASVCFDSEKKYSDTHKRELQAELLTQVSGQKQEVHDIKAGQSELTKMFCSKPCFVFIDNVVHYDQLSDFFPDHLRDDGRENRLRILVTSRDLNARSYLPFHDEKSVEVYPVDRLDDASSLAALRRYMAVADSSEEKFTGEFVKIEGIAKLCYGTPILLSTIGRDLKFRRHKPDYYEDVMKRLEQADFSSYNKLRLENFFLSVFNLLDDRIKASFLDICKLMYRSDWDRLRYIIGDTAMDELSDRLMIRKDH